MIDERFLLHRYKATSHASVAAAVMLCFFLLRGLARGEGIHGDLMTILMAMAVTKVTFLIFFRLKD